MSESFECHYFRAEVKEGVCQSPKKRNICKTCGYNPIKGKRFKVSFCVITEDRDFTTGDIEAELEKFETANPISIENLQISQERRAGT